MKQESIVVIGMGNIIFHDEGLGVYLVKYLETNYELPENLTLVDGGTMGFDIMNYFQMYEKIWIVTTDSMDEKPGTIFHYSAEEMVLKKQIRQTANEAELSFMLESCAFHDEMGEVEIVGMIPENILDVKMGLSDTVISKMPELLDVVHRALEEEGVMLRSKESTRSFQEIIDSYANPMIDQSSFKTNGNHY